MVVSRVLRIGAKVVLISGAAALPAFGWDASKKDAESFASVKIFHKRRIFEKISL